MELIFTKQADRWVAEFIANNDFNLHIEGVVEGNVSVFQRGSESGNYAFVKEGTPHPSYANVYDYDFAALVYPKFIKVSCATEPTSGIVTSDGEITEIKAQTKEIEITSNGMTEVTPDAGFAYLNSVKVKTNVAQSGEGSGSAEYHYLQFISSKAKDYIQYATECKADSFGVIAMASAVILGDEEAISFVSSAKFDFNAYSSYSSGGKITVGSIVEHLIGIDFTEITEEEFYNLNGGGIA